MKLFQEVIFEVLSMENALKRPLLFFVWTLYDKHFKNKDMTVVCMLQLVFNYCYLYMLIILDLFPDFLIIPIHFSNIFKYFYDSYSNHPHSFYSYWYFFSELIKKYYNSLFFSTRYLHVFSLLCWDFEIWYLFSPLIST